MEVKLWLQHIDNKELTRIITLPMCEVNINLFEYSNGGIQKFDVTKYESDFNISFYKNEDLKKFNEALNELKLLATTDEVIALTELYPLYDIHEILNLVKNLDYEFLEDKNFDDILEELELDSNITVEDLIKMGYLQCSTGILKLTKENF